MAANNLRLGDIPLVFNLVDAAEADTEAGLPVPGNANVTDAPGYVMPCAGYIVGVSATSAQASGCTATVTPKINSTNVTGLSAVCTNSAPSGYDLGHAQEHSSQKFAAGDVVKCMYITTDGGSYTVKDIAAIVWIRPALYG